MWKLVIEVCAIEMTLRSNSVILKNRVIVGMMEAVLYRNNTDTKQCGVKEQSNCCWGGGSVL